MKEKDYKRKMSTKFMSMKLDYVSCDFTLLNCFAVQNEKKSKKKYDNNKNAPSYSITVNSVAIAFENDLIVNIIINRPRRHNIISDKNVYFFIYSSILVVYASIFFVFAVLYV